MCPPRRPRSRPLPLEERLPASPAVALTSEGGPPPLPDEGWPSDRDLPKLMFGAPSACLSVAIIGAPMANISLPVGAGIVLAGMLGAAGTALAAYASLYRRWREIGVHAQALGRIVLADGGEGDARAEVATRLYTVATKHRSARALPSARERLESLHRDVLGAS